MSLAKISLWEKRKTSYVPKREVGSFSVVTKDIPDFALVVGNPARVIGWWSEAGEKMEFDKDGIFISPRTGIKYKFEDGKVIEK